MHIQAGVVNILHWGENSQICKRGLVLNLLICKRGLVLNLYFFQETRICYANEIKPCFLFEMTFWHALCSSSAVHLLWRSLCGGCTGQEWTTSVTILRDQVQHHVHGEWSGSSGRASRGNHPKGGSLLVIVVDSSGGFVLFHFHFVYCVGW